MRTLISPISKGDVELKRTGFLRLMRKRLLVTWIPRSYPGSIGVSVAHSLMLIWTHVLPSQETVAHISAGHVNTPHAEIYDSRCSKHLTPYHDALKSSIKIPPKSFQAANKQSLSAVGMGKMTIDIPNRADVSKLRLTEVLYTLEAG